MITEPLGRLEQRRIVVDVALRFGALQAEVRGSNKDSGVAWIQQRYLDSRETRHLDRFAELPGRK